MYTTRILANFIADTTCDSLRTDTRDAALRCLLDLIGAAAETAPTSAT